MTTNEKIQISILMEIFINQNVGQSINQWVDLSAQLPPDQKLILLLKPKFRFFGKSDNSLDENGHYRHQTIKMDVATGSKHLILDPVFLSGLTQIDCTATFMVVGKSSDSHNPQRHEISKNETCQPKEVIK